MLLMFVVTKIWSEAGAYVNYKKNNVLILLISSQKMYFGDDDAFYDVIIQEPVWKWRQTTDMKSAGIHLLNPYSFSSFLD